MVPEGTQQVRGSLICLLPTRIWRGRNTDKPSATTVAAQATSKWDLMGEEASLFLVSVPDEWAVEGKVTSRLLKWVLELIRIGIKYLGNPEQAPVTVAFARNLDVHG